jgi:hypothetical protein
VCVDSHVVRSKHDVSLNLTAILNLKNNIHLLEAHLIVGNLCLKLNTVESGDRNLRIYADILVSFVCMVSCFKRSYSLINCVLYYCNT